MFYGWRSDEQEMADLVDELLQSELVPEDVVSEVERLYAGGKYREALVCALKA
jgi:hypothetical protein